MATLNPPMQGPMRKRDVTSRVCAALFGGYAAASVLSMLLARVIPLAKPDATTTAVLSTAILYLVAILWAFAAPSPSRAWLVLIAIIVIAGGLTFGLIMLGGRA
jgi:hypothetical protein